MEANSQSFPQLNDDVVFEVFKLLSLPERKNARLVCKQWHRVSNRQMFAENEAFFISNMYKLHSVVEVLSKCQRKTLNLKFDLRFFDESSKILWRKFGRRIQSLKFYLCLFPPDIIEQIFVQCKNLNEFSACGGGVDGFCFFDETMPRKKSILQIDSDVVRPKLRILHLDSLALVLRACDLHLISSVFPQLTSLRINLPLNDVKDCHKPLNLTVLFNLLDNKLKDLEILHIEFPLYLHFDADPIDFTSVSQFNLSRLKNVSMSLKPFILKGDSLNKILHYKFWTSLNMSWIHGSERDLTVVTRVLNECPLLEELNVFIILSSFSYFSDIFEALVKSRLKSLKVQTSDDSWPLNFSKLFISAASSSFEELPYNDTVEYLSVHSKSSAEFSSLFVKYFRNVRDLSVRPGDVNAVFKYQKNLKSLRIEPLGSILTDEAPVHSSIESLEMMNIRPLLVDVFTAYQFPNLKYLVINESKVCNEKILRLTMEEDSIPSMDLDVNGENWNNVIGQNYSEDKTLIDTSIFIEKTNKLMLSIFRKSPLLEAIEFKSDYYLNEEAFIVFFQSCLHFHQLRYVSFFSYSPCIDQIMLKREAVKYFKKYPSFRGLWCATLRFNFFFYYNIVTKKYEFSYHDFSDDHFFCIYFHEFWRYKR